MTQKQMLILAALGIGAYFLISRANAGISTGTGALIRTGTGQPVSTTGNPYALLGAGAVTGVLDWLNQPGDVPASVDITPGSFGAGYAYDSADPLQYE